VACHREQHRAGPGPVVASSAEGRAAGPLETDPRDADPARLAGQHSRRHLAAALARQWSQFARQAVDRRAPGLASTGTAPSSPAAAQHARAKNTGLPATRNGPSSSASERRKVALGDCGRTYGTSCPHEHSCVTCPVLRIDPGQRARLTAIRDNLTARVAEAEREGWLGQAEGLRVSLAAARDKLAQLDERTRRAATVRTGGRVLKPHRINFDERPPAPPPTVPLCRHAMVPARLPGRLRLSRRPHSASRP
jgi:hypothetical protein